MGCPLKSFAHSRSPIESDCLLTLLADIARYNYIYSSNESFRKVKLSKVLICKHKQASDRCFHLQMFVENIFISILFLMFLELVSSKIRLKSLKTTLDSFKSTINRPWSPFTNVFGVLNGFKL